MTINEVSNESLNRFIAEKFEPMPTEFPRAGRTRKGWTFSEEIWAKTMIGWQPRAFCADPACTVMLMEDEHIAESGKGTTSCFVLYLNPTVNGMEDPTWITHIGTDLKRTVAEAYALSRGWKPDA